MRVIRVAADGFEAAAAALRRSPLPANPAAEETVDRIIADGRERGDSALIELGRRFDSPDLESLEVCHWDWDSACESIDPASREAIGVAIRNIRAFHEAQVRDSWFHEANGALTGQLIRPIERVGIYVPGGTAVYPSSVLMTAVPAKVAGVPNLVMCTPCGKNGSIHPL